MAVQPVLSCLNRNNLSGTCQYFENPSKAHTAEVTDNGPLLMENTIKSEVIEEEEIEVAENFDVPQSSPLNYSLQVQEYDRKEETRCERNQKEDELYEEENKTEINQEECEPPLEVLVPQIKVVELDIEEAVRTNYYHAQNAGEPQLAAESGVAASCPRRQRAGGGPVTCAECGRAFRFRSHLQRHAQSVHGGWRPYACEACGRTFARSEHLAVHVRTHTGDKPFACEVCGKRFARADNRATHMRTHTKEKPYACPEEGCGAAFATGSHLAAHRRLHAGVRPFACADCGASFATATHLRAHTRTHTGERPYACPEEGCGARFGTSSARAAHARTHTGERPYACPRGCGRAFAFASGRDSHRCRPPIQGHTLQLQ